MSTNLRQRTPVGGSDLVKRNKDETTSVAFVRRKRITSRRPFSAVTLICYPVVLFILYAISPLFPTLGRLADTFLRGRYSPYQRKDLFRFGLYYDMVKDPTKSVFPELLPTSLSTAHDVFLEEYEAFRSEHSVPAFMEVDARAKRFDAQSKWKVLFLRLYKVDTCAAPHFPRTIRLIEKESSSLNVQTIMFSRMAPGKHLSNHVGPNKGVIRLLIGLKIPNNNNNNNHDDDSEQPTRPYLKVYSCVHYPDLGNVQDPSCAPFVHEWHTAGQEIAFDDSFGHAAGNPSNNNNNNNNDNNQEEERIALFLDLARHDLKGWRERLINYIVLLVIRYLPADPGKDILIQGTNQFCERVGLSSVQVS